MTQDLKRERKTYDISKPEEKEAWLQARAQDVTSSDVAALFRDPEGSGQNPYCTEYELWLQKAAGEIKHIDVSDRMKWGNRYERATAQGIAEDQGWEIRAWNTYERIPELRIGASYDYRIVGEPKAVLEIKCIDYWVFKKTWIERSDGTFEPPPHIEWQIQQEMLVSRYEQAYLGAMVGGNQVILSHHVANQGMQEAIVDAVSEFWLSIEAGQEPKPEYSRDVKNLQRRYNYSSGNAYQGPALERLHQLARAYTDRKVRNKQFEADFDTIKCEILDILKDADAVVLEGFKKFTCKANKKGSRVLLIEREEEEGAA